MRTENEIRAMSSEELQQYYVELTKIGPSDKSYANAKALIDFIKGLKRWKEPQTIKARNIAGHAITVDGLTVGKDSTADLFIWQYRALARYLEAVDDKDHDLAFPPVKAPQRAAAAVIALLLLLSACFTGRAQNQTLVFGSPGGYQVYSIAGLNGGTNNLIGTNTFNSGVILTNVVTNNIWYNSNGVSYFATSYVTNTSTNVPGLFSLANYDLADLFISYAVNGAFTGTNATITWDYSTDSALWQSNALTTLLLDNGLAQVSTNVQLSQFGPGFIRLNTISFPSATLAITNVVVEVSRKRSKTGP